MKIDLKSEVGLETMIEHLDLTGKVALVGGSTQGIGKAIALELAKLNATVILAGRNEEKLKEVKSELEASANQSHSIMVADYSVPDVVKMAVGRVVEDYPSVHIVVNNTGGPPSGTATDATPEEYLAAYNQHLIVNQIILQAVVEGMKKEGYGRIINILSTSVKQPIRNLGVSNTTRGAVAQWAKTLANELGPYGITVNNILPGMTSTGRLESILQARSKKSGRTVEEEAELMMKTVPAQRFADPSEVAYAACFLASPAGSYVNGINLPVDGGRIGGL